LPEITAMENKYFALGPSEQSRIVKIIRILFGLGCIAIAIFWVIFISRSVNTVRSLWITLVFLTGFGAYQIWAGLGHAIRFIEIGHNKIILKKNSFLPLRKIDASELRKIELFPLNLIFYPHNGKKTILRFGTVYADVIDPVKSEIEKFASDNNILFEIMSEEF
jgi:hypothetical protein